MTNQSRFCDGLQRRDLLKVGVAGLFVLITTWGYGADGAISASATIVGIWVGCAAFVGSLLGKRAIRAMQSEAWAMFNTKEFMFIH